MAESVGLHHEVLVYGTDWCGDTTRIRATLDALEVPYNYYNIDLDEGMKRSAYALQNGAAKVPVVKLDNNEVLVEPSTAELDAALHRAGYLR